MRTRRPLTTISIAVAVFGIAACGGSDGGGSSGDACGSVQAVADSLASGEAAESAEEALAALGTFAETLADLADNAPDEIKESAEILAEGTKTLSEANPVDPSEEVLEILTSDSYDEAGEALEDYALDTCGINLDG